MLKSTDLIRHGLPWRQGTFLSRYFRLLRFQGSYLPIGGRYIVIERTLRIYPMPSGRTYRPSRGLAATRLQRALALCLGKLGWYRSIKKNSLCVGWTRTTLSACHTYFLITNLAASFSFALTLSNSDIEYILLEPWVCGCSCLRLVHFSTHDLPYLRYASLVDISSSWGLRFLLISNATNRANSGTWSMMSNALMTTMGIVICDLSWFRELGERSLLLSFSPEDLQVLSFHLSNNRLSARTCLYWELSCHGLQAILLWRDQNKSEGKSLCLTLFSLYLPYSPIFKTIWDCPSSRLTLQIWAILLISANIYAIILLIFLMCNF